MTIIAVISDTHIGSSTALCPPKYTIHGDRDPNEAQVVEYNNCQKWLYAAWLDFWRYTAQLAGIRGKTRKTRLVVFHLGDAVDGKHHNSVQVMEEIPDQIQAAQDLLKPIAEMADTMYLTYGTGAHNGGAAEHETTIGRKLGIHTNYEFSLDVDGVVFDLAHTGRAGRRDYTSAAAGLAVEVARDYQTDGKPAPRYTLRGHTHLIDDSGSKLPDTRAIIVPSWQLRTAYGHAVAANRKRSDIGGLIIDTDNPDFPILGKMRYKAPGGAIQTEKV